jgi:hypothetical protein
MKEHNETSPEEAFLNVIADWLSATGEVFVVLRFPYAAGSRDYAFCISLEAVKGVIGRVPPATDVIVFRKPQLPLRGKVTDAFISRAFGTIPEKSSYLIVNLRPDPGYFCSGRSGSSHTELAEDLKDLGETEVALGIEPTWWHADDENMISLRKDGIRAVY